MVVKRSILLLLLLSVCAGPAQAYTVLPAVHSHDLEHNLLQPTDVAVGANGRVYVVDGVNGCIKVFDADGAFQQQFGEPGSRPGQLESPTGIAIGDDGSIFVADTGNARVQLFAASGKFLRLIDLPAGEGGRKADPTDVVFDRRNNYLVVVDNDNHRLLRYRLPDWELDAVLGTEGAGDGQFNYPFLAAANRHGDVFVVDVLNARIQVWGAAGHIRDIAAWGVDPGQLYRPKGVCVDGDGRLFVSDSVMGVVQVFGASGDLVGVLGTPGGDIIKWKTPMGLAVDGRRLYVVEMLYNRVRAYNLPGGQKDTP